MRRSARRYRQDRRNAREKCASLNEKCTVRLVRQERLSRARGAERSLEAHEARKKTSNSKEESNSKRNTSNSKEEYKQLKRRRTQKNRRIHDAQLLRGEHGDTQNIQKSEERILRNTKKKVHLSAQRRKNKTKTGHKQKTAKAHEARSGGDNKPSQTGGDTQRSRSALWPPESRRGDRRGPAEQGRRKKTHKRTAEADRPS